MYDFVKRLILSLYIKDFSLIILLSNVYLYIHMLIMYRNIYDINMMYKNLTTDYKEYVLKNYNFNLYIISFSKFENIFENYKIDEISNNRFDLLKTIIDIIKTTKELKNYAKDIDKYVVDANLINYINNSIIQNNINNVDSKILNIYSNVGNYLVNLDLNFNNNLYAYDSNNILNHMCYINYFFKYGIDISKNIKTTDILYDENFNDINKMSYNMVIGNLQDDIKNIIHADCCNNIKQLKIRGTKAEPLIIQLVSTILKKNGIAMLIMPDNTLSNTSIQHVNTRKYLVNNFNILDVISLDKKRSLLVFQNSGKTTNINLSSFINNNKLNISCSDIEKNNYSFYYNNYAVSVSDNKINNKSFKDVIKIKDIMNIYTPVEYDEYNKNDKNYNEVLVCYKYNKLKIVKYDRNNDYNYVFSIKSKIDTTTQKYMNNYLNYLIIKNLNFLTKGKIQQLDIDKINDLEIDISSLNVQENVLSYIEINNTIIEKNTLQIQNLISMKNNLIANLIRDLPTKKISEICTISDKSTEKNTIMILKNSNSAGSVELTMNDKDESPNIYYLTNIKNYDKECLYNILKMYEVDLKKMANITNTIKLGLNKLENLEVPVLDDISKSVLLNYLKLYDNINNLNEQNRLLLGLNLFDIILP